MLTLYIIVVVGILKNIQFIFLLKTIMSSLQNCKFEKESVIELKVFYSCLHLKFQLTLIRKGSLHLNA